MRVARLLQASDLANSSAAAGDVAVPHPLGDDDNAAMQVDAKAPPEVKTVAPVTRFTKGARCVFSSTICILFCDSLGRSLLERQAASDFILQHQHAFTHEQLQPYAVSYEDFVDACKRYFCFVWR